MAALERGVRIRWVKPYDGSTYALAVAGVAAVAIAAVAIAASVIPAKRAASVDPLTALRSE